MLANRAISRTPLPAVRNCLAFSTFALVSGGRPNLIDSARAAACPLKIRSRRDCLKCEAIIVDRSNSDIPFEVAVSSFCSSTHSDTSWSRHVSTNPTRSTRDLPILSMDQTTPRR